MWTGVEEISKNTTIKTFITNNLFLDLTFSHLNWVIINFAISVSIHIIYFNIRTYQQRQVYNSVNVGVVFNQLKNMSSKISRSFIKTNGILLSFGNYIIKQVVDAGALGSRESLSMPQIINYMETWK